MITIPRVLSGIFCHMFILEFSLVCIYKYSFFVVWFSTIKISQLVVVVTNIGNWDPTYTEQLPLNPLIE